MTLAGRGFQVYRIRNWKFYGTIASSAFLFWRYEADDDVDHDLDLRVGGGGMEVLLPMPHL